MSGLGSSDPTLRSNFTTLDLDLLEEVLRRHGLAKLWAATGWFREWLQKSYHVPDALLSRMEERRPHFRFNAERGQRGGVLARPAVHRKVPVLPSAAKKPGCFFDE